LDRVVDINFYPTGEAKHSNSKWRPVGLGVMGLQDAFFKMRIPYESESAKKMSAQIAAAIYYHALETSCELSKKHGAFPAFKESRYVDGELQMHLAQKMGIEVPGTDFDWNRLAREIQAHGIRNSLLIAIAPTATIASIVGSFESIEPQISNFFKRETLSGEFLQVNKYLIEDLKREGLWNEEMRNEIISHEGSIQGITRIPQAMRDLYKTTWEISQKTLIELSADRQNFICQSQSLNLFLEEPTIGKLSSMYMYAWKKGVKTTYYLRSRSKTRITKTTTAGSGNSGAGATSAGSPVMAASSGGGAMSAAAPASVEAQAVPAKTYTAEEAVFCSLENPEACEACQ
jgi:ribonucleoside-diphosphate reductase alpha chain